MTREQRFQQAATDLGYSFEGEIKRGGNYVAFTRQANQVFVSGQIPRVGDTVVVTGRVGTDVTLSQAQMGAKVSAMRALAILRQAVGNLDAIEQILRVTVYVQSASDFTQHSEVADGASNLLSEVLGPAGAHTRTSIGVFALPKSASVEVDLIAAIKG